jgi:hypothetical protein
MEYKRIRLHLDHLEMLTRVKVGELEEEGRNSEAEIVHYLNNGWKIVSTSPITESVARELGPPLSFTYTSGIEVFMIKE